MATRDNGTKLLLLGETGAGKSSMGNFILGKKKFKPAVGMLAGTTSPSCGYVEYGQYTLIAIDTPGLQDAFEGQKDHKTFQDIAEGIKLVGDGVHAILYTVNVSKRFTKSSQAIFQYFEKMENFWPFVIIVFTHADEVGDSIEEQEEYLADLVKDKKCPKELKWLMENVRGNHILVATKETSSEYRDGRMKRLLKLLDDVNIANPGKKYTNKMFQEVVRNYENLSEEDAKEANITLIENQTKDTSCFPGDALVSTVHGVKLMKDLAPGDCALYLSPEGKITSSKVIDFLHYEPSSTREFMEIRTESTTLTISSNHLLFACINGEKTIAISAKNLVPGHKLHSVGNDKDVLESEVLAIRSVFKTGVYAPVTNSGMMIVDGILVSCYASFVSHSIAHFALKPLRAMKAILPQKGNITIEEGVHPYAQVLWKVVTAVSPKSLS